MVDNLTKSNQEILLAAMKARMPTMLVGPPGTGKTASIKKIAKDMGYHIISLVGSRMEPTDVVGLPRGEHVGDSEDGEPIWATVNLSPHWQVEILKRKKVILFLDEWGNSPPAVQAAFLTILQDREFPNGHKFPKETIVIGAMNPPEEGADSFEMALPTTNRIFWISWSPTVESWYEGMLAGWWVDISPEEAKWKSTIVRFIKDNPGYLQKLPTLDGTVEVKGVNRKDASAMTVYNSAWPSRRSWDNLSRVLAQASSNVYVQDKISEGIVGFGATKQFRQWLRENENNLRPIDVIKDPKLMDWKKANPNDANMILRVAVEMITNEHSEQVLNLFEHIVDIGRPNIIAPYTRDLLYKVNGSDIDEEIGKRNKAQAKRIVQKYTELMKKTTDR